MNSSLILVAVLSCFCCIEVIQAGVLGREELPKEKLSAEEAALNITKECGWDKLVIEPNIFIDRDASEKFVRSAKCGLSCILKSVGLVTDSNELVKEAVERIDLNDPARGYFIFSCTDEEFYDKCSHVKDSDDCEYAYKLIDCFSSVCKETSR